MRSLDIRSEGAINLLSEFLDMDVDVNIDMDIDSVPSPDERQGRNRFAEHFAHGMYFIIFFTFPAFLAHATPWPNLVAALFID